MLGTVYFRILVVLTSLLTDDVETARFVTSARIFELLIGLPLLMTGVVLPVMTVAARDDPGRLRYVTQRLTEVAALAGGLICLVLILGARPILVLLGGAQYAERGRGPAPAEPDGPHALPRRPGTRRSSPCTARRRWPSR